MEDQQIATLLTSSAQFTPIPGFKITYGTAGFRANASVLSSTVFCAGILAALRSLKTGKMVGLMITASHNPIDDNGVKIADPSGGMMAQTWEPFADALVGFQSPEELVQLVLEFTKKEKISFGGPKSAVILLGRDTRPSGKSLLECAKRGIASIIGAVAINMGILTTPQLHWMVRCRNKDINASEYDYFKQLSKSFMSLVGLNPLKETTSSKPNSTLLIDAANGVGGEKLHEVKKSLMGIELQVRNSGKEGILNDGVGADFVQKEKVAPQGFGPSDVGMRCVSLDGDADRFVYFRVISTDSNKIDLIDGDKILSLFALFIKAQLNILQKMDDKGAGDQFVTRIGVVQTAYANGASTDYLRQLGLEVAFTPTGVKYLHEKAAEYDIGIYFEANGHGTILFSDTFLSMIEARVNEPMFSSTGSEYERAILRLVAVTQLINQAVGDALSGLLLVEAILQYMGWSIETWSKLYRDLPSRQLKIKVADRTAVITANAETQVVKPFGLQKMIDSETAKYTKGRCFIRPSGTEDVIRVYAEASTQEAVDTLAQSVGQIVGDILG
ncbi:Phosphoglucosamine mutase [Zostera marina]|uniref:Phosphoacetylglucosamine mutase n=1 Tax=Zostera marina TaxID=29655 RepID=A0A0K9Q0L2_ZOSMR|nr:Phosphoglucosamine mutase [Zostera marina]